MDARPTSVGGLLGAVSFCACFGFLTAERVGLFTLTTRTESALVWLGVAVTVVATAGFVYRGGGLAGAWLLALGPALAFTLNLFLPVIAGLLTAVLYGGASGVAVATALALPGYALGRVAGAIGLGTTENGSPES